MEAATCMAGVVAPPAPGLLHPTSTGGATKDILKSLRQLKILPPFPFLLRCSPSTPLPYSQSPLPTTAALSAVQELDSAGEGSEVAVWWENSSPHPAWSSGSRHSEGEPFLSLLPLSLPQLSPALCFETPSAGIAPLPPGQWEKQQGWGEKRGGMCL